MLYTWLAEFGIHTIFPSQDEEESIVSSSVLSTFAPALFGGMPAGRAAGAAAGIIAGPNQVQKVVKDDPIGGSSFAGGSSSFAGGSSSCAGGPFRMSAQSASCVSPAWSGA